MSRSKRFYKAVAARQTRRHSKHMLAMALENEAPTISSSDKAYVLPSWFLEHNVKTAQDLATIPDQVVFCKCDACMKIKLDDEAFQDGEQADDKSDELQEKDDSRRAPDDICYKLFSELRNVTCASFMPSRNGKLRQDSTVILRVEGDSGVSRLEPTYMSQIVTQVAKVSKTISVITFDLEALEELGCEFHQQDSERAEKENSTTQGWEPNMDSFTTFLDHFFAVRSKASADAESWQRNQQVLSTILDAAQLKSAARYAEMGQADGSDAVLIHIIDCPFTHRVLGYEVKRRVLTRFAEMVRARREQGQAVTMLLSTSYWVYLGGFEEFTKIGGAESSTVTANFNDVTNLDHRMEIRKGVINTQRFRRLLRLQAPSNLFCAEFLAYSSDWTSTELGQTYNSFGKKLWSSDDVRKALARIIGRAWGIREHKSQMTLSDICLVLERVGLVSQAEPDVSQPTEEQAGEASEYPKNRQPKVSKIL